MESRDVIIVGGGPAGVSAALNLVRACKSVLILDEENPRHAASARMHGFITQDGASPGQFRRKAYRELEAYPGFARTHERLVAVEESRTGLHLTTATGAHFHTRALLLAVGIRDLHPALAGFEGLWGKQIFHCPYCHGWELCGQPIGVLGRPPLEISKALSLKAWSGDLLFLPTVSRSRSTFARVWKRPESASWRRGSSSSRGPGTRVEGLYSCAWRGAR